ncbi:MAG: DUF4388 domain-containing protein [Desulfobacter sp.]|nr:MAG: DUF4388 domain-containing protein [Desulfobacter sp.]
MASTQINGISGQITGVSLSSFLQMVEMEQKTCTINVMTKQNIGHIYFHNGEIVDAGSMNLKQADALYDILSWRNFIIEVEPNPSRRDNVINLPLLQIIMESARRADENQPDEQPQAVADESIALKTMVSNEFCLEVGVRLLIEMTGFDMAFRTTLVGIENDRYLLLKVPAPFDAFDPDRIKNGDMIVKSLYKGTIYAFRSKMMAVISTPSRLMFIRYPESIEHHELRAHKRFKCSIVAQAEVIAGERGGIIENISLGGCRCTIETRPSEPIRPKDLLNQTIPFRCRIPGTPEEVKFTGQVKNAQKISDEIAVGIEFIYDDNSEETRKIIEGYIKLIEYASDNV